MSLKGLLCYLIFVLVFEPQLQYCWYTGDDQKKMVNIADKLELQTIEN